MKTGLMLLCVILTGAGIGSAFAEKWAFSALCFITFAIGLIVLVRAGLKRVR